MDIRVAETHVSRLFFVGDHVYKKKKPVLFGFIDHRTREARERACHEEVRLNRRLAPDVYLGVVDIVGRGRVPVDHLVEMRAMPAERKLSALLGDDGVADEVRAIARTMAAFHARAERSETIDAAGSPAAVRRLWDDNTEQIRSIAKGDIPSSVVDEVARLSARYVDGRSALFAGRVREGKIVDGHGDLLAEDIFCLPDGPRILDCLEFDPALRYGDVIADIAFLAMDLERLGRADLADVLLERYAEFSGDDAPHTLIHHWIAYRAWVRAKVACLRAPIEGAPREDPVALARLALAHLQLAMPRLVMIGGLPGSGKTTLTHSVADVRRWAHLHSDHVRKELAGMAPRQPAEAAFRTGLYAPDATVRTYDALIRRASELLALGESVVVDASWVDRALRDRAVAAAFSTHAELSEIRCVAPYEVRAKRITERSRGASDATVAIAAAMEQVAESWPEAVSVDTTGSEAEAARRVLAVIAREPVEDPVAGLIDLSAAHRAADAARLARA